MNTSSASAAMTLPAALMGLLAVAVLVTALGGLKVPLLTNMRLSLVVKDSNLERRSDEDQKYLA